LAGFRVKRNGGFFCVRFVYGFSLVVFGHGASCRDLPRHERQDRVFAVTHNPLIDTNGTDQTAGGQRAGGVASLAGRSDEGMDFAKTDQAIRLGGHRIQRQYTLFFRSFRTDAFGAHVRILRLRGLKLPWITGARPDFRGPATAVALPVVVVAVHEEQALVVFREGGNFIAGG